MSTIERAGDVIDNAIGNEIVEVFQGDRVFVPIRYAVDISTWAFSLSSVLVHATYTVDDEGRGALANVVDTMPQPVYIAPTVARSNTEAMRVDVMIPPNCYAGEVGFAPPQVVALVCWIRATQGPGVAPMLSTRLPVIFRKAL